MGVFVDWVRNLAGKRAVQVALMGVVMGGPISFNGNGANIVIDWICL